MKFRFAKKQIAQCLGEQTYRGEYECKIIGPDGVVKDHWFSKNIVTDEGINKLLNITANLASLTNWYVGIYEGVYTPVAGDTAATFPGSATETSAYAESTRQQWIPASSTSKQLTNTASKATFTFTSSKTIYGAFVTTVSTKGATTGTLLSAVNFGSPKSVGLGDQLQVTYALSAASA